jgi:hypothetical protein
VLLEYVLLCDELMVIGEENSSTWVEDGFWRVEVAMVDHVGVWGRLATWAMTGSGHELDCR